MTALGNTGPGPKPDPDTVNVEPPAVGDAPVTATDDMLAGAYDSTGTPPPDGMRTGAPPPALMDRRSPVPTPGGVTHSSAVLGAAGARTHAGIGRVTPVVRLMSDTVRGAPTTPPKLEPLMTMACPPSVDSAPRATPAPPLIDVTVGLTQVKFSTEGGIRTV